MRLWVKILMVAAMTIAILVPLTMVRGVIDERQARRAEAVSNIAASYGGRQVVSGPVLVVPYTESVREQAADAAGIMRTTERRRTRHWTFFPETLVVDGEMMPDTRKRGLHEVRVYEWQGTVQARFDARIPDDAAEGAGRSIGEPWLAFGIADVRGLRELPRMQVDGRVLALAQGIGHEDGPGVHARLRAPAAGARMAFASRVDLQLRGTESFAMMPLARDNDLRLRSSWPHPRFEGLSPVHDLDGAGFSAQWKVASLSTEAQRRYRKQASLAREVQPYQPWSPDPDTAGLTLVDPVNAYLQAERATKYGLLFVLLTFVAFFMFELMRQQPIHPIQYGLVGLAIAIFFLLLVSLGEHIPFGLAYLSAAAACIGLIGFYLAAVLGGALRGAAFAGMLATLYAALYGLLVSEDNALVLGAGLLFVVLAAIMVVTRRVDWYQTSMRPHVR
ncbi:cell envelope integrity protein CreD [Luteimonas terricola]|uniref:Cell envelope integrity protein CreD n=1 Tax=Luteimonas terricola TaxID=645597 RepID=A0ABQ2EFC1_9GAMM|nr:cell envelope integrity protein CreD [Luteimonas terricola]GGK09837.1 cell envelope integrity protein CreD [Luteimonas terricola]